MTLRVSLFIVLILIFFSGCELFNNNPSSAPIVPADPTSDIVDTSDTYIDKQWYFNSSYLDLHDIHKEYNGSTGSTIIQIVDIGIEQEHEDIKSNLFLAYSYNAETAQSYNCDAEAGESHGTLCAGIAGARGFNEKGIRGVNPLGKLAGYKFTTNDDTGGFQYTMSDLNRAWFSGDGANDITISSNSWGGCYSFSTDEEDILKQGTSILRDGKGRIYVVAGGNGRAGDDSCPNVSKESSSNIYHVTNNPYVITVASITSNNTYSSFSNQGSNILVSAYGTNIYSTNLNDTYSRFDGTSAATPIVSGAIALVLEACPNLTYRDIKYLLAKTSTQVDTTNPTWITNSAGLKHSVDYGYGLINTKEMISTCKNNYVNLIADTTIQKTISNINNNIPNNNINGLDTNITITNNKTIEWIGVWSDVKFDDMGEFEFYVTSPAGTTTKLLHSNNALGSTNINESFRLSSVAFVDENSSGVWQVKIADRNTNNQTNRLLRSIRLEIIGH